jgi:hypothetical protein
MKRRGVLVSQKRRILLFGSRKRATLWRINPDFHRKNPGKSMFGQRISLREYDEGIKRRRKRRQKKKQKGEAKDKKYYLLHV